VDELVVVAELVVVDVSELVDELVKDDVVVLDVLAVDVLDVVAVEDDVLVLDEVADDVLDVLTVDVLDVLTVDVLDVVTVDVLVLVDVELPDEVLDDVTVDVLDELDVTVLVLEEEEVDVDVVLMVEVVVEDVVVDTDVVALDVCVDVCVVDGDVSSQLMNEPSNWRSVSSFRASASRAVRVSVPLVGPNTSSAGATARNTWTTPAASSRQSRSKNVPLYRPWSCSVISRSSASRPTVVFSRQVAMSPVLSMTPYLTSATPASCLSGAHPRRSPAGELPSTDMAASKRWQSARPTIELSRLTWLAHSCRYCV